MKKLILPLLVAVLTTWTDFIGYCQTTNQTPQQEFYQTAFQYLTTQDTNSTTFQTDNADVWTGLAYKNGLNFGADLGVDVPVYKRSIYTEVAMRNADVGGTIVNLRGGVGYCLTKFDTRLSLGINGGYDFDINKGIMEIYADLKKALPGTENAYGGMRLGWETPLDSTKVERELIFWPVIVGFKF